MALIITMTNTADNETETLTLQSAILAKLAIGFFKTNPVGENQTQLQRLAKGIKSYLLTGYRSGMSVLAMEAVATEEVDENDIEES